MLFRPARRRLTRIVVPLIALLGPLQAPAAIVHLQTSGIIRMTSGTDAFELDGAHFTGTYSYDTGSTLLSTSQFEHLVQARYPALTAQVVYADRPNGAADVVLDLSPLLIVTNVYASGAPQRDTLSIGTTVVDFDGMGNIVVPSQNFYFFGQDHFPGTGAMPLPVFGAGDVSFFQFGNFSAGGSSYEFPSATTGFSVQVVPVPAAAWLFGSALGVVAVLRRRKVAGVESRG